MIDFHSHTTRCMHAVGSMDAYVQQAIACGISEFGFSDHSHWMLHAQGQRYAMRADELDDYVADVRQMQKKYNRLPSECTHGEQAFQIRLGMEMDFIPARLTEARAVQQRYAWDYIIGSVHNVGFEHLQSPETYAEWHIDDVCELYFCQLQMMLRERFCDIIGHLDLPKKMGSRPTSGFLPYIKPLIPDMLAAKVAVEVNTSGKDSPAGEFMPGWDVLKLLVEAGVPLTLGGDSHAPHQVGRHFAEALSGLKQLGVRELVRFEQRKMIAVALV